MLLPRWLIKYQAEGKIPSLSILFKVQLQRERNSIPNSYTKIKWLAHINSKRMLLGWLGRERKAGRLDMSPWPRKQNKEAELCHSLYEIFTLHAPTRPSSRIIPHSHIKHVHTDGRCNRWANLGNAFNAMRKGEENLWNDIFLPMCQDSRQYALSLGDTHSCLSKCILRRRNLVTLGMFASSTISLSF